VEDRSDHHSPTWGTRCADPASTHERRRDRAVTNPPRGGDLDVARARDQWVRPQQRASSRSSVLRAAPSSVA
jgi:hypothetical protein